MILKIAENTNGDVVEFRLQHNEDGGIDLYDVTNDLYIVTLHVDPAKDKIYLERHVSVDCDVYLVEGIEDYIQIKSD